MVTYSDRETKNWAFFDVKLPHAEIEQPFWAHFGNDIMHAPW